MLASVTTSGFGLRYAGDRRVMTVDAIGDAWTVDEIEKAVARAMEEKRIQGNETLPAVMTLEIAGLSLKVDFKGEIRLE